MPQDINQSTKLVADIAIEEVNHLENKPSRKNPAAVELGRLGGLKGGRARAIKLTQEQRSAIAKKAARKRWDK